RPPAGLSNVVAIASGGGHCLALKPDGTVFGWGDNDSGQALGVASNSLGHLVFGTVAIGGQVLSNVVAIAAGSRCSLALRKDGTVVGWGSNGFHQTDVPAGLTNVVAIAAGENFCLALTTNGDSSAPALH